MKKNNREYCLTKVKKTEERNFVANTFKSIGKLYWEENATMYWYIFTVQDTVVTQATDDHISEFLKMVRNKKCKKNVSKCQRTR